MTHRFMLSIWIIVAILVIPVPAAASTQPAPGDLVMRNAAARVPIRLVVPVIKVDVWVTVAPYRGKTWDFSRITRQAALLQGRPTPGKTGNAVIAAHAELTYRRPGPFYHLDDLQIGDEITVIQGKTPYVYRVFTMGTVQPDDPTPIAQSEKEILTLLTCSGYTKGVYKTRFFVQASRIA